MKIYFAGGFEYHRRPELEGCLIPQYPRWYRLYSYHFLLIFNKQSNTHRVKKEECVNADILIEEEIKLYGNLLCNVAPRRKPETGT